MRIHHRGCQRYNSVVVYPGGKNSIVLRLGGQAKSATFPVLSWFSIIRNLRAERSFIVYPGRHRRHNFYKVERCFEVVCKSFFISLTLLFSLCKTYIIHALLVRSDVTLIRCLLRNIASQQRKKHSEITAVVSSEPVTVQCARTFYNPQPNFCVEPAAHLWAHDAFLSTVAVPEDPRSPLLNEKLKSGYIQPQTGDSTGWR